MKLRLGTTAACIAILIAFAGNWDAPARAQQRTKAAANTFELARADADSPMPASVPAGPSDLLLVDVADGKLLLPEFPEVEPNETRSGATDAVPRTAPEARTARSPGDVPLPGDTDAVAYVREASAYYSVDPALVFCLIHQESGGRRFAVSPKGASGYMQLMPATARRFGVTDIFDKRQNIWAGVRYLKLLLNMFGDNIPLALAGYNAGEHRVIREGYRVPRITETVNYVRAITGRYGRLTHRYPAAPQTVASTAPLLQSVPGRN